MQLKVVPIATSIMLMMSQVATGSSDLAGSWRDAAVSSSAGEPPRPSDASVEVKPSVSWRDEKTVDVNHDWAVMMTSLGVDREGLTALPDASDGRTIDTRSRIELPGLAEDEPSIVFDMDESRHMVVPLFDSATEPKTERASADDAALPIGEVEAFVWRGRSDRGETAILAFANEDGVWSLGSGLITDGSGTTRNVQGQVDGSATIRTLVDASEAVESTVKPLRRQTTPRPDSSAQNYLPRAVNPGSVRVDLLAVGFSNPGGQVVTPATLTTKALAGITSFNTAMDDSSSSNWVISGVYAQLRGLMIVDVTQNTTTTSSDLNRLDQPNGTGVYEVSVALGVDAVGGYRLDYTNDCGQARLSTNVFVWESTNGGCQNDESFTFAHELAHLAWADHRYAYCDDSSDPEPVEGPPLSWNCPDPTVKRTLMGRGHDTLRILQFSNPDHDFSPSGRPTGAGTTNDHNNASRIAQNVVSKLSSKRSYKAPSGGRYTALEFPERVLDTRGASQVGPYSSPFTTTAREVPVLISEIPAKAKYVAFNVTLITNSSSGGAMRISSSKSRVDSTWKTGIVRFKPGDTRSQTVVVPLSTYRTIWMRTSSSASVDAIVDVVGFFGSSGSYLHELSTPKRVFNSQISAGSNNAATVLLTSLSDCPSSTTAVFANITAVSASGNGYLQAYGFYNSPTFGSYSTLNYQASENVGNGTLVEVDNRRFKIYAKTTVTVVVDVLGCFTSSSSGGRQLALYSQPSHRTTATLSNDGHYDVSMGGGSARPSLWVADVTSSSQASNLKGYKPSLSSPPTISNINLAPGDGISNTAITPTSYSSSAYRMRVQRGPQSGGSTTFRVLQLGYFY